MVKVAWRQGRTLASEVVGRGMLEEVAEERSWGISPDFCVLTEI
jgi:hypothetical protein